MSDENTTVRIMVGLVRLRDDLMRQRAAITADIDRQIAAVEAELLIMVASDPPGEEDRR